MIIHNPVRHLRRARRHVEALLKLDLYKDVRESAEELQRRLQLPLTEALSKVPGESIAARARRLGITRQTYYQWLNGRARPNNEMARRLSELTGIPESQIRGVRPELAAE